MSAGLCSLLDIQKPPDALMGFSFRSSSLSDGNAYASLPRTHTHTQNTKHKKDLLLRMKRKEKADLGPSGTVSGKEEENEAEASVTLWALVPLVAKWGTLRMLLLLGGQETAIGEWAR